METGKAVYTTVCKSGWGYELTYPPTDVPVVVPVVYIETQHIYSLENHFFKIVQDVSLMYLVWSNVALLWQ